MGKNNHPKKNPASRPKDTPLDDKLGPFEFFIGCAIGVLQIAVPMLNISTNLPIGLLLLLAVLVLLADSARRYFKARGWSKGGLVCTWILLLGVCGIMVWSSPLIRPGRNARQGFKGDTNRIHWVTNFFAKINTVSSLANNQTSPIFLVWTDVINYAEPTTISLVNINLRLRDGTTNKGEHLLFGSPLSAGLPGGRQMTLHDADSLISKLAQRVEKGARVSSFIPVYFPSLPKTTEEANEAVDGGVLAILFADLYGNTVSAKFMFNKADAASNHLTFPPGFLPSLKGSKKDQ